MRVEVSDEAPGFPTPREQATDAPHGRGLRIVESLADVWGVEMRRDRPGKTVWFSSPLAAGDGDGGCERAPTGRSPVLGRAYGGAGGRRRADGTAAPRSRLAGPPGPSRGCGPCSTGCATGSSPPTSRGDPLRQRAAEELLGWPHGSLVGRPVFDLVPDSMAAAVGEDYGAFVRSRAQDLVGRPLDVVIKRADGTEVHTEFVVGMFEHPLAGRVVVGIFRAPRRARSCSAGRS